MLIDFSDALVNKFKLFGGSNGNKIGVTHDGVEYMLKFPAKARTNKDMSYQNSCISEYISCHIFSHLGFDTQETVLGKYGKKIIVACKNFEGDGYVFRDFAHLKNSIIDSEQDGYGTELEDILSVISEQQLVDSEVLLSFFWRMFIVDVFLGNFDRHNGNWGFLVNEDRGVARIAPIFDCGSCLYPQITDEGMKHILCHEDEIDLRIFKFPTSAIKIDDKKLNYYQFCMTANDKGFFSAMLDIYSRINMDDINRIIDNCDELSDIYKVFLIRMLSERKRKILDSAYDRIKNIFEYMNSSTKLKPIR